jgi:hypothetical protein
MVRQCHRAGSMKERLFLSWFRVAYVVCVLAGACVVCALVI